MCCGRTPLQTLIETKEVWRHKIDNLDNQSESDKQISLRLGKCPMMSKLVHIIQYQNQKKESQNKVIW